MSQMLQKGANIALAKVAPNCNDMLIAVEWTKKHPDETEFEIDASAFMLTENNKIRNDDDFIFYNQPQSPDQAIELLNTQDTHSQTFQVALNRIAPAIHKVSFVLTLHEAKERQQNFGMLAGITVTILNATTKMPLAVYVLHDAEVETALILTELYRYQGEWKFKAIGQGYIDGLDVLARNYGVAIDANVQETPNSAAVEPAQKPTVVKYMEAIKPNIEKYKEKAKRAKQDNLNESGTRLIIDNVLQGILGYQLQHIKTEQKIPNRQLRIDYLLALDNRNIMVVEAKQINLNLNDKHVSQVTSYAYFMKIDFALLTNGVEWKLYYVIPKKLKKYEYHLVFAINLLEFNECVAERLFSISRFGIAEKSLEILKRKMQIFNKMDDIIASNEVIEQITRMINRENAECQVTVDEVRHAIEMNVLK